MELIWWRHCEINEIGYDGKLNDDNWELLEETVGWIRVKVRARIRAGI